MRVDEERMKIVQIVVTTVSLFLFKFHSSKKDNVFDIPVALPANQKKVNRSTKALKPHVQFLFAKIISQPFARKNQLGLFS